MSRYLLTGATGFVGAYLARRLLEQGREVHVLARESSDLWRLEGVEKELTVHHVDLLDAEGLEQTLKRVRPTDIWHLATYGGIPNQQDVLRITLTNFQGTINLLHAAQQVDFESFINTGSSSEYGVKGTPMREADLPEPVTAYGAAKAGSTLFAQALARSRNLPIYTLRLFTPYGPYEDPSRLVTSIAKAFLQGLPPRLGSKTSVRDYVYVEDVFGAYDCLKTQVLPVGEVFNIGSGQQYSVSDVVATFTKVVGTSIEPLWGSALARPYEPTVWMADISKSKQMLGWKPTTSMEQGVLAMLSWLKERDGAVANVATFN